MSLNPALERLLSHEIRLACTRRKRVQHASGGRQPLSGAMVAEVVEKVLEAAHYAALGPVPNKIAGRGAPPDNARIILVHDICRALTDLGLSDGLHFESDHQSLAVELYTIVAARIWGNSGGNVLNPRKTFRRSKDAKIILN